MAKFMDVHSGFVGVTEEQLCAAHEQDLAIEAAEGVHFVAGVHRRAGGSGQDRGGTLTGPPG